MITYTKKTPWFRCYFLYAVWRVFISSTHARCQSRAQTSFSLVSNERINKLELFSHNPFLFLSAQRRRQVMKMKMRSNHSNLKYLLTWNFLCLISAVSNLTETDDKTTSEAPAEVQSIQGLWFCHAHYQPRFLSLQRKSQGNEVDWRTFSSSAQWNSLIKILWLGPFQFQQEQDRNSGCKDLL